MVCELCRLCGCFGLSRRATRYRLLSRGALRKPPRGGYRAGVNNPAWRGVLVATALPYTDDLTVDLDRYADHVTWLADNGCVGVVPNGSLGEYQVLTADERAAVLRTAVAAAPAGFAVVPGVSAYGAREAVYWTDQAAQAGCPAVMALPPNGYRADEAAVVAHFQAVAAVGLPVIAYNNPIDTKVDLTPPLLARLYDDGLIVAVKEFTGDVRRAYELAERAPLLRWDSRTEFVQAIKLAMDGAGRYGGPCRPPRAPLAESAATAVREALALALKG
jgi:dihydrodipicolinate synthase/N-acetylneuraminate lyase